MLIEFSVIPIGIGESMGDQIAKVLKIVDESGLPYKANPMGTVIEGNWEDVLAIIKKCHQEVIKSSPRIITSISIDDRPGKPNRITEKLKSVEKRLGKEVKK
ncbi:MAG TPA: MTH1187 family thiamine-binding protein [Thermodesulfovibrionia bacterium]|nr:MTH1187 family thiamine-binding protein [Thermodesulfovibrionia bacterium]